MSYDLNFETDMNPYQFVPISDTVDDIAKYQEVFTPMKTSKSSAREVATDVVNDYAGPLTVVSGAVNVATDPKIHQAIRALQTATQPMRQTPAMMRAIPVAMTTIGKQIVGDGLNGMNLPFLITLTNVGGNALYDYATDTVSPWADAAKETAANLGLFELAGRTVTGKYKPLFGTALGAGGYLWDKYFGEEE